MNALDCIAVGAFVGWAVGNVVLAIGRLWERRQ